jgi:flagellin
MKKSISILMILAYFILTGCSNVIDKKLQTDEANISVESAYENISVSTQGTSEDGKKSDLQGIAYNNNGLYVMVSSDGKIFSSTDGRNWAERNSGTGMKLFSVIWGNKQFIAVGWEGTIIYSIDGIKWDAIDSGVAITLNKIIWDGEHYLAIGSGTILVSSDGKAWVEKESPYLEDFINGVDKYYYNIADILWDGNQFIAAGEGNFIITSADLDNWVVRVPHSGGNGMFCDLEWDGDIYVVVGDHLAMSTSADGHEWVDKSLEIENIENVNDYYTLCLNSIIWGGNKFIAVGQRGLIIESKNGLEWSTIPNDTQPDLIKSYMMGLNT